MPSKASSVAPRTPLAGACSTFVNGLSCTLPLWDDAQVAQENWGGSLTVPVSSSTGDGGKEAKQVFSGSKSLTSGRRGSASPAAETHFEDEATRHSVEAFIVSLRPPLPSNLDGGEVGEVSSSDELVWRRPTEVFHPFRPIVHRNVTPFVDPYATAEALVPVDAKVEESKCQAFSSGVSNTGGTASQRKGGGVPRQSDTAGAAPRAFHQLYPEAITVLEMFSHEEKELWRRCTPTESVGRYRALPTLMQPYDGVLIAGCAETPAQACESRYSTGLRHKLKQAEQLAALKEAPPFLMSAFNSSILAVEQAQRYVPEGGYLWELVYPHAPGTCHPVYNPFGKYAVKLFVDGAYRKVLVDDCLPADVLGRPFLTTTSRKELWPCLIAKALLKALGPVSGVQALTSAPALIVTALMGNWVPQYLFPRHDTVSTTALLLLYQRQLKQLESLAEPVVKDSTESLSPQGRADDIGVVAAKNAKNGAREQQGSSNAAPQKRSSPSSTPKPSVKRQQNRRVSGVSGGAGEDAVPLKQLTATEYCEPVIDEPLPEQPFYVCGLRTPPPETLKSAAVRRAIDGYGSGPQLYTIHAMKPFRNTVALLLHTTPRSCLSEGIFEEEKDADDVSALHEWSGCIVQGGMCLATGAAMPPCALEGVAKADGISTHVNAIPITDMIIMDSNRAASVTSCWLTLEEFMLQMETIIVWRKLAGRYSNAVCVSGESLLQHQGNGSATGCVWSTDSPQSAVSHKKSAAARRGEALLMPTGASSIITTQPSTPSPPLSVWWKLTAQKAVEAVVVVSSPATKEVVGREVLAANASSTTSPSPRSCQPVDFPGPNGSLGVSPEEAEVHLEREVRFSHFQWDRAEPLNFIGSIAYTNGVLRSTVLYFRPGVHLICVDVYRAQVLDRISFLSDAVMEVQPDLSHGVDRNGFASITDAGVYPAVVSFDTESVWLKRVFSLTTKTCVTLQLSTLDSTEDLAAHRIIHTAANQTSTMMSGGKGGGNHGKTTAGARSALQGGSAAARVGRSGSSLWAPGSSTADGKKRSSVLLAGEGTDGSASMVDSRDASKSILRFSSLVLVNLDHPDDCCVGTAGRLVKLQLEPNEKGYLIMAYTNVPSLQMQKILQEKAAADDSADWLLPTPLPVNTAPEEVQHSPSNASSVTVSMASPPLFPAGCWKLTLRSNAELQTFDAVAHDLNNVTIEADLPRGGSAVLFRRICSITETTHVSIVADLRAPVPMPYTVRIVRLPSPALSIPTSATPRAVRGVSNNNVVAGTSEPTTGDPGSAGRTAPSRSSTFVVYESPPTKYRLFVADVLLSATVDVSVAKSNKGPITSGTAAGGTTVFAIEAVISEEDAAAWNERCRRSQEETFLQYREVAEQQAALTCEREPAGPQSNPLFPQQKGEGSDSRRQLATETVEKTMSRSATTGNTTKTGQKRRGSLRPQSGLLSTGLDSFNRDSHRRKSSLMQPETGHDATILQNLDTTHPDWNVHMSTRLSFSSSRVDVKAETPAPDALLELRKHMKETMSWLQEWSETGSSGGEAATAACVISPLAAATLSSGKPGAQRGQRDAAAAAATMEDALRTEAARQSRFMYLCNPQHIIIPSLNPAGNTDAAGALANASVSLHAHKAKHDANSSSSGTGAAHPAAVGGTQAARYSRKELLQPSAGTFASALEDAHSAYSPLALMHDELAMQIRYAAPLHPSQYSIELLPLRSWEESPSLASQGKDSAVSAGSAVSSATSRGRRPKNSGATAAALGTPARVHSTAPTMTNSSAPRTFVDMTTGGFSSVAAAAASTLSCPLTVPEREKMLLGLRGPLTQATEGWDIAHAQARVTKAENQLLLKSSFNAYFEAMTERKAANRDMTDTAPPMAYPSLPSTKDSELGAS